MRGPRVTVVGCGLMGRWHAEYAQRAGGEVVGVVDDEPAARAALHRRFPGARPLDPQDDWLAESTPRVVHVCTPGASHVAYVDAALDAGCHALVEKPLAPDLAATRSLLDRADAAGLRLAPVHQFPFQRGVRTLASSAALGDRLQVVHRVYTAGAAGESAETGREVLLDMIPHSVSLFFALDLAVPTAAWRVLSYTASGLELSAEAQGTELRVHFSLAARPTRNELQIVGTRATATADLFHGYAFLEPGGVSRGDKILLPFRRGARQVVRAAANLGWRALRRQPAYPGLPELIQAFYRSLGNEPAAVAREEILAAAALRDGVGEA